MSYNRGSMKKHPLYITWYGMICRCTRKSNSEYRRYGARGISVCDRWMKFENFVQDMDGRPAGMSLERIDNNGDYEPTNCRWATAKEQASNRRSNKWITLNGKVKTLYQWADELGINRTTVTQRINAYGWTPEKALTTPTRRWVHKGVLL